MAYDESWLAGIPDPGDEAALGRELAQATAEHPDVAAAHDRWQQAKQRADAVTCTLGDVLDGPYLDLREAEHRAYEEWLTIAASYAPAGGQDRP